MENIEALRKEREELFEKVFTGKIPKRVPIGYSFYNAFVIQFANMDLVKSQWDTDGLLLEACDKFCKEIFSDAIPIGTRIVPYPYQMLKSRAMVMVGGFMQHPEVYGMEAEWYDDFIKSPLDTIIEKIFPRLFSALDADSCIRSFNMTKAVVSFQQEATTIGKIRQAMANKYGYFSPPPGSSGGGIKCPFDYLSDYIRGFTGIVKDVRRIPDKVQEACERVLPFLVKKATAKKPSYLGGAIITTHMPAFMRTKDFETLYYPTFKKMIEAFTSKGMGVTVVLENDWMRYLDHLRDLPDNVKLLFEEGEPEIIKQKLGDKFILTGFYPFKLLLTGTKEQVIDKAKELIDILAPGGRYYFDFDMGAITCQNNARENIIALSEYLKNNANY